MGWGSGWADESETCERAVLSCEISHGEGSEGKTGITDISRAHPNPNPNPLPLSPPSPQLEIDLQEIKLSRDVALEGLKADRIKLERRCRALEEQTSLADAFAEFERDMADLAHQRDGLIAENRALRLAGAHIPGGGGTDRRPAPRVAGPSGALTARDAKVDVLRRELARAESERDALQREVDTLRHQQRGLAVNRRQARDAHGRLRDVQEELRRRDRDLIEQSLVRRRGTRWSSRW